MKCSVIAGPYFGRHFNFPDLVGWADDGLRRPLLLNVSEMKAQHNRISVSFDAAAQ